MLLHIATSLTVFYVTWVLYLGVMNLYAKHKAKTLGTVAFVLALPIVLLGLVLDFLTNVLASPLLLELPRWDKKEWLLSPRLKRFIQIGPGNGESWIRQWRFAVSWWISINLLSPFDPTGGHTHTPGDY